MLKGFTIYKPPSLTYTEEQIPLQGFLWSDLDENWSGWILALFLSGNPKFSEIKKFLEFFQKFLEISRNFKKIQNISKKFQKLHEISWNFVKFLDISGNFNIFLKFQEISWNVLKFPKISNNLLKNYNKFKQHKKSTDLSGTPGTSWDQLLF